MTRKEKALDTFLNGYHCSQSILNAFADDFGIGGDFAKTISLGLAGGSGTHGYCGCISGGYMALSMMYGHCEPGHPEKLGVLITKNREFFETFKKRHHQVNCRDLIRLDVFTEKGITEFIDRNIKETFCAGLVADTMDILESIMNEPAIR